MRTLLVIAVSGLLCGPIINVSHSAELPRVECTINHPQAASMICPNVRTKSTLWLYPDSFRGSVFPQGLKLGDQLSCLIVSGSFVDCVRP